MPSCQTLMGILVQCFVVVGLPDTDFALAIVFIFEIDIHNSL